MALPPTRRITKKGAPITAASAQAKSGSGTVTPPAWAARSSAYSSSRGSDTANVAGLSVRSTQRSAAPARVTSSAQFCWIAPPESRAAAVIATGAPAASLSQVASAARRASSMRAPAEELAALAPQEIGDHHAVHLGGAVH